MLQKRAHETDPKDDDGSPSKRRRLSLVGSSKPLRNEEVTARPTISILELTLLLAHRLHDCRTSGYGQIRCFGGRLGTAFQVLPGVSPIHPPLS